MPRITAEGQEGVGGGAKEERVDHPGIPLREGIQRMRQREDDVEVQDWEKVGPARVDPVLTRLPLTLRAMAIATGIKGEAGRAAVVTRRPAPAQKGGAAGRDRAQRPMLYRREPVRLAKRIAMGAHDLREREPAGREGRHRLYGDGTHRLPLEGVKRSSRSSGDPGATCVCRVN